jgi:hypothetical protein
MAARMVGVRPGAAIPVCMLHEFVKYWEHKIVNKY